MTYQDDNVAGDGTRRSSSSGRSPAKGTRWGSWLNRFGTQYLLDAGSWAVALAVAAVLRYEFQIDRVEWLPLLGLMIAAIVLQLITGIVTFLYRGRFLPGTFDEMRALTITVLVVGIIITVPVLIAPTFMGIPRSLGFISLPIALLLMFALRFLRRIYIESKFGPGVRSTPALIVGAGFHGTRIAQRLSADADAIFWPVGFVDDDPAKQHLQVGRVRVRGTIPELPEIVEQTRAKVLIVAMAQPDPEILRHLQDVAAELEIQVKVMPPLDRAIEGHDGTNEKGTDLRDLSIEDLLGRPTLDTKVEEVAEYLTGRRVLVTGAGGSIGSELCVQISRFNPSELIMLDRDETGLQQVQLNIAGHGLLDSKDVVLADIRDLQGLQRIFNDRQPEVVFHAAALKHLPLLEQYPDEGWKTNVLGTLNVLKAASAVDVEKFVNVSTDKAANPTSVLGHSKRVAEKLTAWMGEQTGKPYISVRFGNVIGSRGSMLPTFTHLIEKGGPVTVTHPDITRFFMTIPEACQLVVHAGAIGSTGEVLILDMGEPVRILDIAKRMIGLSGKDVDIVFTGLREGEKMHEELVGNKETASRPYHPKISHAHVDTISEERLDYDGWMTRMSQRPRNNDTQVLSPVKVSHNE